MKPKYEETIEVIGRIDGSLVCTLTWREHTFTYDLPKGFDRWTPTEYKALLKNKVIPELRLKLLSLQKKLLDDAPAEEPVKSLEDFLPRIEYSEQDIDKLNKAQAKRERKAAKLKAVQ